MPITRRQFELGVDEEIADFMRKIHDFLSEHKKSAFSIDEIEVEILAEGILSPVDRLKIIKLKKALDKLVDIQAI